MRTHAQYGGDRLVHQAQPCFGDSVLDGGSNSGSRVPVRVAVGMRQAGEEPPEYGWALVIPLSVWAGLLGAGLLGNYEEYGVGAHGIVDAHSCTGAEHGWGVGCGHLLTVVPAGETP